MSIADRLPILYLTLRQFRAGRAVWVVAFFAAIPVILAGIYLLDPESLPSLTFLSGTYLQLLAPTVVPLATLVLATSALGNEIGDRTLPYLVIKPVPRLRIVLEKYLGVAIVGILTFLITLVVTWGMVMRDGGSFDTAPLWPLLLATAAGILAYGSLFLLVSLAIPRSLLVGIIYIFLWESLLGRFIPGVRYVSIRHFTQSVFVEALDNSAIQLPDAIQLETALIALAVLAAISLVLAAIRLRQMDLD